MTSSLAPALLSTRLQHLLKKHRRRTRTCSTGTISWSQRPISQLRTYLEERRLRTHRSLLRSSMQMAARACGHPEDSLIYPDHKIYLQLPKLRRWLHPLPNTTTLHDAILLLGEDKTDSLMAKIRNVIDSIVALQSYRYPTYVGEGDMPWHPRLDPGLSRLLCRIAHLNAPCATCRCGVKWWPSEPEGIRPPG